MKIRIKPLRPKFATPSAAMEVERTTTVQGIANPYQHRRWRKLRAHQLAVEPLCRHCAAEGRVRAATVADHVRDHKGSATAFWCGALQSLCKACHDSKTARTNPRGGRDRDRLTRSG